MQNHNALENINWRKDNFMKSNEKYTVPNYMDNIINETDNGYLLMHRFLIWGNYNNTGEDSKKSINNLKPRCFNNTDSDKLHTLLANSLKKTELNTQIKLAAKAMAESAVYEIKCFHMDQTWNMVVGLGTTSVSETSMTLHHIYGVPYIPGQTLKGIVRSYIICEFFESNEEAAMKNELFTWMFGREEIADKDGKNFDSRQGSLIFFDAAPIFKNDAKYKIDIMTNHHMKYYEKNDIKYLNDSEHPNPIRMLVISGAEFAFRIAVKKKNADCPNLKLYFEEHVNGISTLLDSAVRYTKAALQFHGAGAKTSVGYGLFKESKENRK